MPFNVMQNVCQLLQCTIMGSFKWYYCLPVLAKTGFLHHERLFPMRLVHDIDHFER